MQARHQVSRNAIELIKRFEGYRASAARLPDGRWTIGYGHTLTAREGATVSAADAEALLLYDLIAVAHAVNEHAYTPLNQNQFDALASFAFNVGADNFLRSAVLRRVNEGALIQAACAMELWRKADFGGERIVIDALVRRRSAEKHLFLTPPDGWVAAPSPILPPKVDYDAPNLVPQQAPMAVVSSLIGERAEARLDVEPVPAPVAPEEELGPTVTERAAAAVTARLVQLFPDKPLEPRPPAPPPVETAPEPEPEPLAEPEPAPAPTPAPVAPLPPVLEGAVQPFPTDSEAPPATEAALPPAKPVAPPRAPPPAPRPAPEAAPVPRASAPRSVASFEAEDETYGVDKRRLVPLLAAGGVSLVLFAGGVFGGLTAVADHAAHPFPGKVISWLLCLLGAVGFVAAAYLLLRLIDGEEDESA
jgi:lysozyme